MKAFRVSPDAWDLTITDRSMPKMTGEELVRAMKNIRSDVPVLMLSGFVSTEDVERLTALGIGAVVGKPVLPNELVAAVQQVLSSSSMADRGIKPEAVQRV